MTTMIVSRRTFESCSYEHHAATGRFVSRMPPSGPGAVINLVTCARPGSVRVSIATERLPWFSPAQYRLWPLWSGQR